MNAHGYCCKITMIFVTFGIVSYQKCQSTTTQCIKYIVLNLNWSNWYVCNSVYCLLILFKQNYNYFICLYPFPLIITNSPWLCFSLISFTLSLMVVGFGMLYKAPLGSKNLWLLHYFACYCSSNFLVYLICHLWPFVFWAT